MTDNHQPLHETGSAEHSPDDYAEVIVFLCAGASYVTGEVLAVSGGARL